MSVGKTFLLWDNERWYRLRMRNLAMNHIWVLVFGLTVGGSAALGAGTGDVTRQPSTTKQMQTRQAVEINKETPNNSSPTQKVDQVQMTTSTAPNAEPQPTLAPAPLSGKVCKLHIKGTNDLKFVEVRGDAEVPRKALKLNKDCDVIELTLETGSMEKSVMGHNWVISATQDMKEILAEAARVGASKDYLPDSPKIIANTKLMGNHQKDTITMPASLFKADERYSYYCTFPGHNNTMRGDFILEK